MSETDRRGDFPRQNTLSATGGSFELSIARPTGGSGAWSMRVGWFEDAGSGAEVSCLVDQGFEKLDPNRIYTFDPTADQVTVAGGAANADGKLVLGWDGANGG